MQPLSTSFFGGVQHMAQGLLALMGSYSMYRGLKLWRDGVFSRLSVRTATLGPFLLLYRDYQGPYDASYKQYQLLAKLLVEAGLLHVSEQSEYQACGLYYDDPKIKPAKECRASFGYIFKAGGQLQSPEDIKKSKEFLQHLSMVKTGELKIGLFAASKCLLVKCPFTDYLSIMVGLMRGYPLLTRSLDKLDQAARKSIRGSMELYLPQERSMVICFPFSDPNSMLQFEQNFLVKGNNSL